ncbi:hypothetical protein QTN25_001398 [Entamoeba marina]
MIISDTNYHTTDSKNYKNHISVGMSKPTLPNITLTAIEKKKKMQKCMFLLLANALLECNEERMDEEQSDGFTSKEIDIDKLLGHFLYNCQYTCCERWID